MRTFRLGSTGLAVGQISILAGLLWLGAPIAPAQASGDIDCDAQVRVLHPTFLRCNTMTLLGPGNDTRANLLMLLLDRDMPPPDFLPAPPAPLPPETLPVLFWKDIRERYFPTRPPGAGADSAFARGEGSRCVSDAGGTAAFKNAVVAAHLPETEREALIGARERLAPICKDLGKGVSASEAEAPVPGVDSPRGQAFATYLHGAAAFYEGRFDPALTAFSALHGNSDAWLADVGDYMAARTELNRLQVGAFDEYGEFAGSAHVDQATATDVAARLDGYLREHPSGAYVASARGLQRRVAWLAGRTDALAAGYAALLARPPLERGLDDATLAEEVDSKLLPSLKPEATRDPLLLAVLDLKAMRGPDKGDPDKAGSETAAAPMRVDLEAQRSAFAANPPLFDFLLASQAFYVDHDPAEVLRRVPDDTKRRFGDHLWFGRQVLRGLALEAKGDRNARGFWKELAPGVARPLDRLTVELALALHDERAGTLDEIFAAGSIVTSPKIRETLLEHGADATLLRRQAKDAAASEGERATALATLLWKEITRGRAADFAADVALVPPGAPTEQTYGAPPPTGVFTRATPGDIDCPSLATTARQLADEPRAVRPRLCLAEFVRESGLDANPIDARPPADDLGGAPSQFPGKPYARSETYKAIIADPAAPAAERAFALYRAIKCYEPANINGCGGEDVPKARRKAWYFALKRDYPASRWAKALSYWW